MTRGRVHGLLLFLLLLARFASTARVARAEEVSELGRARAAALSAGATPHAALRQLLNLWEVEDPRAIEAALGEAATKATSPGARVYAQVLSADARARRGDGAGAAARMATLGYVEDWLFVGPFDDENRVGFGTVYQPESDVLDPIVPGRAYDGKERPVRFRATTDEHRGVVFDFGDWLRPRTQICGYATTLVRAKSGSKAPRTISLFVGAEGAIKLWWNADKVLEDPAYRGFDFDRMGAAVELRPGWNRVTAKVCSDVSSPRFALRIGDEKGAPDLALEISADLALTSEVKRDKGPARRPSAKIEGPLQALERLAAGAKPRPADQEALSRYLVLTQGDPRGEHRARDLAAQAANAAPTWERELFAADLSEDKNQMRARVDKADALTRGDTRGRVAVLVARGRLARSSVNWRDATPFYEEALALDPDHPVATLGRIELFLQAGLPRTALDVAERAIARRPSSLGLLRVYAAQLRAVGREADADAADARWFAFRADDSALINRQIERAAARGDGAAAERWLGRLGQAEPDLVYRQTIAARTYRTLGQDKKARAALEAALEIAPEEQSTLRALADLAGESGDRDGQLRQLRKIRELYPQDKDVRAYIEFLAPAKPRQDESYAWDKEKILEAAKAPSQKGDRVRVLRKLVVTTVFENGLASRFHQIVFSPLTDEACAEARQFFFGFEGGRQDVELRLSRVYRPDGSVAEATESGEGAANDPSIAMYTSQRTFAVSFPRLSPGDVVELRYRVDDVAVKNDVADSFYDVEMLQGRDPISSSEYVLIAPKQKQLSTVVANLPGATTSVKEAGEQRITTFTASDVPGLVAEPSQPPASELVGQVHVSSFKSWTEVGRWYWNLAKDQLDVDDAVKKKVAEIEKSAKTEADKVKAVYHYAIGLRYVALEFGLEGIKPRRCALTLARGWGDCKDKATVIVTMLRELGIPATLVLVRTGMRGDLPKDAPPSLGVFDHAIAYVPSLDLYLDGTAEGTGSGELPAMDRNAVALQINEGDAKLVRLPSPAADKSPHVRRIELAVGVDGSASFSFENQVTGVNAPAWRARYAPEGTRRERATQDLVTFFGTVELPREAAVGVKDADDVEAPFAMSVKGKAPSFARREGDTLSMRTASSLSLMTSLAALSTRKTDLVLGSLSSSSEDRVIKLPAGAKIVQKPDPVNVVTPFGRVSIEVKEEPGKITIKSRFAVEKQRISVSEYAAFRDFCQKADSALEQRLVVKP